MVEPQEKVGLKKLLGMVEDRFLVECCGGFIFFFPPRR